MEPREAHGGAAANPSLCARDSAPGLVRTVLLIVALAKLMVRYRSRFAVTGARSLIVVAHGARSVTARSKYILPRVKAEPDVVDPTVVFCFDKFGPLDLQPHPGKQWAPAAAGKGTTGQPRRRRRAAFHRPHGVRHLLAAYDLVSCSTPAKPNWALLTTVTPR